MSGRCYEKAYDLVWMAVSFMFIKSSDFFFWGGGQKLMLKVDCAVSTRCHGKYRKYVSSLWPLLVAAYDCKGLAPPSGRSYSAKKKKSAPVPRIHLCPSDCAEVDI